MNKKLFAELIESMRQMDKITRGERLASRAFHVDALSTKQVRSKIDQSQPEFAPARRKGLRPRSGP